MAQDMKGNGKMTNKMALELKPGRMVHDMMDITLKGKSQVKVLIFGMTTPVMKEIGFPIK